MLMENEGCNSWHNIGGSSVIKGVAFIALPATSPKRAGTFYREMLGLGAGEWDVDAWVEVNSPCGCAIAFENAERPYLALETDGVADEIARLRSAGVEVVQEIRPSFEEDTNAYCRAAWIRDSEGNAVMIHQCRPARGW